MTQLVLADPRRSVLTSQAHDRATKAAGALAELFSRRPDLRGVHAPADLAEDTVRWCA